jgi:hypothetical protein
VLDIKVSGAQDAQQTVYRQCCRWNKPEDARKRMSLSSAFSSVSVARASSFTDYMILIF